MRRWIAQPERTVNKFTNMWARWTRPAIQQLNSPGDAPPLWPNYPMERRLPPQGLRRGDFMSARLACPPGHSSNGHKELVQERLTDASWQALPYLPAPPGGGLGGPERSRLTVPELRQIRQVVSVLLGSDSQMFVRETSVGPGYATVRVMVAVPRALPRRLASQAALADRLGGLMEGRRAKVMVTDPDCLLSEDLQGFQIASPKY